MRSICVRHNFEAAHRLPLLGGKCTNLHGHSWWAEVTVTAPDVGPYGTVVEFGGFKACMRAWIDTHLDHGAMLGEADVLVPALEEAGCKVFAFGRDWSGAAWPTVEAVSELLAAQAVHWLTRAGTNPPGTHISAVRVSETHVNAAEWTADTPRRVTSADAWARATQALKESA
jgi:6-pyruvoyltetrahydropterin/6-carboxytetrahydropterin synthase